MQHLSEIRVHLHAAERALGLAQGSSSELARVREAVGSLLVAVHELAGAWEQHLSGPTVEAEQPTPPSRPMRRR